MAKPIEPTPVLSGEDARRIWEELRAPRDPQRAEQDAAAAAFYRQARTGQVVTIPLRQSAHRR